MNSSSILIDEEIIGIELEWSLWLFLIFYLFWINSQNLWSFHPVLYISNTGYLGYN
jgi:hypothetical protein